MDVVLSDIRQSCSLAASLLHSIFLNKVLAETSCFFEAWCRNMLEILAYNLCQITVNVYWLVCQGIGMVLFSEPGSLRHCKILRATHKIIAVLIGQGNRFFSSLLLHAFEGGLRK